MGILSDNFDNIKRKIDRELAKASNESFKLPGSSSTPIQQERIVPVNVTPNITVSPPNVTVKAPKINTKEITDAINTGIRGLVGELTQAQGGGVVQAFSGGSTQTQLKAGNNKIGSVDIDGVEVTDGAFPVSLPEDYIVTNGGQKYLKTKDEDSLSGEILEQLKINNAYLQEIVGEKLTTVDVEE